MPGLVSRRQIQLLWLILAWGLCPSSGLSLEELGHQFNQLQSNYNEIKQELAAKSSRLEAMEQKVEQQELLLNAWKAGQSSDKSAGQIVDKQLAGKGGIWRTCRELKAADPSLDSGMYWIDPDGQSGDASINVYCDMTTGSTSVLHDSENQIDVGHCPDPGCYSRPINYMATENQMLALIELSDQCHQSIRYDCISAPLEVNGVAYSWWNDKDGISRKFWSGNKTELHVCQCGIEANCVEPFMPCNCDSSLPTLLADNGVITDKNVLPITRLNFGRTELGNSVGLHTLGRLECSGKVTVNGMPKSCRDLWIIGHTLSGFHSVQGVKNLETIYCDFSKLPSDQNFQKWIGFENIQSWPTYFHVQKNANYSVLTAGKIPFEIEKLNIGNAMNLSSGIFTAPRSGNYFFSFTGLAHFPKTQIRSYLEVSLYLNSGTTIATAYSDENPSSNHGYETLTLQTTIHLKAGDWVWLGTSWAANSQLYDDNEFNRPNTHFTGWLLQEDIF